MLPCQPLGRQRLWWSGRGSGDGPRGVSQMLPGGISSVPGLAPSSLATSWSAWLGLRIEFGHHLFFPLPSLLQLGWALGKLAMGAEEAMWRAQSPHLPVITLLLLTPPCGWLSGAPYTCCLQYPSDNIQVASITARL